MVSIRCDKDARLRVSGDYPFFNVANQYTAQFTKIEDAHFTTTVTGSGRGIGANSGCYISHWQINNCRFAQNMAFGIRGDMIGCVVNKCLFGAIGGVSGTLQPIYSVGSFSAPIAASNINVFKDCEFSRCSSTYIVRMENGIKPKFDGCIFEVNTATEAVIRIKGMYFPVFVNCWWEVNTAPNMLLLDIADGIDSTQLVIDQCQIDSGTPYSTAIINWGATVNKSLALTNTLFARGSGVLCNEGTVPTFSYGNRSTTTGINFTTGAASFTNLNSSGVINTAGIVSTAGNQVRGLYSLPNTGTTIVTDIPVSSGNGGGLVIMRGSRNDGVSICQVYAITIKRSGGFGNDVEATLIGRAPSSDTGSCTFSSGSGNLVINRGSNTGNLYFTLLI